MKRILGIALVGLMAGSASIHAEEDEIGINMGVASMHAAHFDNFSMGLTYQHNESFKGIKPRVDLEFVQISDKDSVNALYKGSLNGVYEFHDVEGGGFLPYVLGGIGYEHVDGEIKDVFDSNAFAQGGVGLSYKQEDVGKFNVESKVLQILGADGQNNEYILTAGVSVPIGGESDECPRKIDGPDEDRDGVEDSVDQCPGTPCYFTVDQYGCPIKATMRLHFDFNKYNIRPESLPKVEQFANYLLHNKGTHVNIIGYTDSIGSEHYNQILSEKRAEAVMRKLIELGVSPDRLSAEGRGESEPVASNDTEKGRALNRRIEVNLTYDNRRKQAYGY